MDLKGRLKSIINPGNEDWRERIQGGNRAGNENLRQTKQYISQVKEAKTKIDRVLSLSEPPELCDWLRKCMCHWVRLPGLKMAYEQAQIVLGQYYKPDGIRSLLREIRQFVNILDTIEDPETARIMGYNNYCYFLRSRVSKIREDYTPQIVDEPLQKKIGIHDTRRFFEEECSQIPILRDLADRRKLCTKVLDVYTKTGTLTKAEILLCGKIFNTCEELKDSGETEISQLMELRKALRNQCGTLEEKIQEANSLYEAITGSLTEEWFERLDPSREGSPICSMSVAEIKAVYQEFLSGIPELLMNDL